MAAEVSVGGKRVGADVFWKTFNLLLGAIRTRNLPVLTLALHLRDRALTGDDILLARKLGWAGENGQFSDEILRIVTHVIGGEDPGHATVVPDSVHLVIFPPKSG